MMIQAVSRYEPMYWRHFTSPSFADVTVGLEKTHYPTSEEDISDEVHLEVCVVLMNTSTVEFDVVVNLAVSDGTAGMYVTEIERK